MAFISGKNHQSIMTFWKKNRQKPSGSYLSRLVAPPNLTGEGESRQQTNEYRLVFEEYGTRLYLEMNGVELGLDCPVLKISAVDAAAKQLSMLAYGNKGQADAIAKQLRSALNKGGHDLVMRPHEQGIFLEERTVEEE